MSCFAKRDHLIRYSHIIFSSLKHSEGTLNFKNINTNGLEIHSSFAIHPYILTIVHIQDYPTIVSIAYQEG